MLTMGVIGWIIVGGLVGWIGSKGGLIFSFFTCLLGALILLAIVKLFTRGRVAS